MQTDQTSIAKTKKIHSTGGANSQFDKTKITNGKGGRGYGKGKGSAKKNAKLGSGHYSSNEAKPPPYNNNKMVKTCCTCGLPGHMSYQCPSTDEAHPAKIWKAGGGDKGKGGGKGGKGGKGSRSPAHNDDGDCDDNGFENGNQSGKKID